MSTDVEAGHADILVVDDDHAIRETLRSILEDEGYAVRAAANGREALDLLESLSPPPRLLIIDLVMPVLDGWQLCAALARHPALSRVPVVVISANGDLDRPAINLETVHPMTKPIRFQALLEHVERYCR